jgi:hypothetical protein
MAERILEKHAEAHCRCGNVVSEATEQTPPETIRALLVASAIHRLGETVAEAADILSQVLACGVIHTISASPVLDAEKKLAMINQIGELINGEPDQAKESAGVGDRKPPH